jgi:endonuclease/exonuclease/phosphatase (EEP) superfamily protein YafD
MWIEREFSKREVASYSAALALLSTAAYLPSLSLQILDLPSHFVLQYAIAAPLVALLVYFLKMHWRFYVVLAAIFLLNIGQLLPYIGTPSAPAASTKPLKILQINVFVLNTEPEKLKKLIEDEQPDLIIGTEVNDTFADMFRSLKKEYPYQDLPKGQQFAAVSKTPLENARIAYFDRRAIPTHLFSLRYHGERLNFVSVHTATPIWSIESRDTTFENIANALKKKMPADLVIAGDFNATPFCPAMKKLLADAHVTSSRAGHGILPSWPAFLPSFLRIPIDHVLLGPGLVALDHHIGPSVHSDHMPSIVTIALAKEVQP